MYSSTTLTGKVLSSGWQRHCRVHCRTTTSETENLFSLPVSSLLLQSHRRQGWHIHVGGTATPYHAPNVEKLSRNSQKLKIGSVGSFNPKRRLSPPPCRLGSHRSSIRSLEPTPFVVKTFIGGCDSTEQQVYWSRNTGKKKAKRKWERDRRCRLRLWYLTVGAWVCAPSVSLVAKGRECSYSLCFSPSFFSNNEHLVSRKHIFFFEKC